MKKNKHAFTFVEILVAITILSLISIFALSWFGKNFEIQSVNEELSFFQERLRELDKNIGNSFTDYEISLFLGEIYFYTSNKSYLSDPQKMVWFDGYTGTIQTSSGIDISRIFSDEFYLSTHSGSQVYEYDFSNHSNYRIETYHNGTEINPILISHYSQIKKENKIRLSKINSWIQSYTGILIKNHIGQKRQFLTNTGQIISSPISLTFEDNQGIATQLTLTP